MRPATRQPREAGAICKALKGIRILTLDGIGPLR